MDDNIVINKNDLFNYSFYDEAQNYTFVLNQEYLKKLLGADIILLEEIEHK